MRPGLLILVTFLVLGIFAPSAHTQESPQPVSAATSSNPESVNVNPTIDPVVEQVLDEAVPESLRSKVLIWAVSCAFFAALCGYLSKLFDWQQVSPKCACRHCLRIHNVCGIASLLSDATSTAGLFYLLSLPYVSAIKAQYYNFQSVTIGILFLAAFCMLLMVIGGFIRLFMPKRKDRRKSKLDAVSCFLVGQRFVGFFLSLLILDNGLSAEAVSDNFTSLLGSHIGDRLLTAIGVEPIRDAAAAVILTICASCTFRWIVPSLFQSRPLALSHTDALLSPSSELAKP